MDADGSVMCFGLSRLVFSAAMQTFLQKAAADLEKTFNAACGFNEVHTVLMKYFTKVGMISQSIGEQAAFLCSLPKPSLERGNNTILYARVLFNAQRVV